MINSELDGVTGEIFTSMGKNELKRKDVLKLI